MKKILVAASVWAGLWAGGMLLFELKSWEAKPDGSWLIATPIFLAATLFAWGIISGKGGAGTIAGTINGFMLAIGAFFGSLLLGNTLASKCLGEWPMAERVAWLMAGAFVGAIAGACSEMTRQGINRKD